MKLLFRFLLLLCTPVFFLPNKASCIDFPPSKYDAQASYFVPRDASGNFNPWELYKIENLSYDRIFDFAETLEKDEFWKSLSAEEFETLIDYCIWAMRFSVPKHRPDLQEHAEKEIENLLEIIREEETSPCFSYPDEPFVYSIEAAAYYGNSYLLKCGWLSKKWKQVKGWVKDNKGPIIVCAVVGTALVVGAITGGVGASSAAAVGGALVGGTLEDDSLPSNHINKPGDVLVQQELPQPPLPNLPTTQLNITPHTEDIYHSIGPKTELIKEELITELVTPPELNTEKTSWENIKEGIRKTSSYLAHEILDSLSQIGEYWYELSPTSNCEAYEEYKELTLSRHEIIDNIFGTNQTDNYSTDVNLSDYNIDMQIGVLPPPGSITGATEKAVTAVKSGAAVGTAIVGSALSQGVSSSNIDTRLPSNPDDLLKDPSWQEISHPKAVEQGHRTFENTETGEQLRFDYAKPEEHGHKGQDHWHKINPNSTGKHDEYLDANDNPVPRNSNESHIYSNQ